MGEGGIEPRYFLHDMQWWEVIRYYAGIQRRSKETWEQNRLLRHQLAIMFCKEGSINRDPRKVFPLPWDEEAVAEMSEEQRQREDDFIRRLQELNRQADEQGKPQAVV